MKSTLVFGALLCLLLLQAAEHLSLLQKYYLGDEGSYLAMSKMVLEGEVLYRDIADYHPPALPFVGAAMFRITGPSYEAARLLILCVQVSISILAFILGRRIFGDVAALFGVAAYVLTEPLIGGIWFVAEPFLTLFTLVVALLAYDLLFTPAGRGSAWRLLLAGLAAGTATAFKQPAGALAVLLTALLCADGLRHGRGAASILRDVLLVAVGFAAPWALLSAYFSAQGAFPDMVYQLLIFPIAVKGARDAAFIVGTAYVFLPLMAFALVLACACLKLLRDARAKRRTNYLPRLVALGFALVACVTAVPRFDLFHALAALPLLAIFAGDILERKALRPEAWPGSIGSVLEAVTAAVLVFAMLQAALIFDPSTNGVKSPGETYLPIAGYIDGPVLAVPFGNWVYFYSNGTHASPYLGLDPVWITPEIDRRAWADVRTSNATVVYIADSLNSECLPDFAPVLAGGLQRDYSPVAQMYGNVFVLKPKNGTAWDGADPWARCGPSG